MDYENIYELIEALGGPAKVARAIDSTPAAVARMRDRGSIRVIYWRDLIEFAKAKKLKPQLTNNRLVDLHYLERVDP